MSDLPQGWATAAFADLIARDGVFSDGDWVESKDQDPNGSIRLLQLADIGDGVFLDKSNRFINEQKFEQLRCTEVLEGDVLIARMPDPLGRACLAPQLRQRCITVVDVAIVRPGQESVQPAWLMHFLNSPEVRQEIEVQSSGTTRRRISRSNLAQLQLAVAPVNEQKRIADKLDTVLARVDACRERLDRVHAILKSFRQAVLTAATSGKLTEEWREDNQVAETAIGLIKRIAEERRHLGLSSAARVIRDEGIEVPETELPSSWTWCRVGDIADVRLGGTPSRKEPRYWGGEIPWVSSGEVANCRITRTAEQITRTGLENSNAKLYPRGSVLIAMIGEGKTRGQAAILDIDASTNQNAAGLVFDAGDIDGTYVWLWALGEYERNRDVGRGGNQPALNGAKVRALPVPLPPLEEQHEIVRRVKVLFAYADRLEARCTAARTQIERLTPALLTKAVRGELVPQDPNDEPASALLERIRAARAE